MSERFSYDNPGTEPVACCPDWKTDDFILNGIHEYLDGGEFATIECPHCETWQHIDLPASAWTIEAERNRAFGRETTTQQAVNEVLKSEENAAWDELFAENKKRLDIIERMNYIVERVKNNAQEVHWRIENIIDAISDTGTHAERSMSILGAIRQLIEINRGMRHEVEKVERVVEKGVPKVVRDKDDIPF